MRTERRNRGIASILAILMLAVLFTLAVSIAAVSNQNELQAANQSRAEAARMQAEGGLSFLLQRLSAVTLSGELDGAGILNAVGVSLASQLNGTPNLAGALVTVGSGTITVPAIVTDATAGRSFCATLTMDSDRVVRLRVTGASGGVARTAQICLDAYTGRSAVFNFGVAARGPVEMKGDAALLGVNLNSEADLYTAAYVDVAVSLFGCAVIEGDLSLSDPDGQVNLSPSAMVGGEWGDARWDHVHTGVDNVLFPEVDPSVFEPFATTIVNSTTIKTLGDNLTNIRIKAGTNPTFNNDMVIQGVVYIETPNKVTFNGSLQLTGVVVTEDAGPNNTADNSLLFAGTSTARGVESLPDDPQFAALKAMPGSFLLAPGFEVNMAGNFNVTGGCMAAENFKFSGSVSGTVTGSILSYGNTTFLETGNVTLNFDKSGAAAEPPGLISRGCLVPDIDTYAE